MSTDLDERFRDASDNSRAPFRGWPSRFDEPRDMSTYAGPHGWMNTGRGGPGVCLCGWNSRNHPGEVVGTHLADMNASPLANTPRPRAE